LLAEAAGKKEKKYGKYVERPHFLATILAPSVSLLMRLADVLFKLFAGFKNGDG
jgi:hypothetical protein